MEKNRRKKTKLSIYIRHSNTKKSSGKMYTWFLKEGKEK